MSGAHEPPPEPPEPPGTKEAHEPPQSAEPGEDRVVRRALLAGGAVWLLVGGALGIALADQGGRGSATGVLVGLSAGSFVTSAWLLLALALDLLTRMPTPRRRVRWTYGMVAMAMVSPLLAVSAATLPR